MQDANQQTGTTTLQLVLAWGFVGIPLALGVLQNSHQLDEALPISAERR